MTTLPATQRPISTSLHADLAQRVVLHAADAQWVDGPEPGVQSRLLDHTGGQPARSTSLLRYLPGARCGQHQQGVGAEILVLDGVLSDASGDHPAGTYLRHPAGGAHAPWSDSGCLLYVKLGQFAPDDLTPVRINTCRAAWLAADVPGLWRLPLHSHGGVHTLLLRSAPGTWFDTHSHPGGEEILVLDGVLHDDLGRYPRHSWIRSPPWSRHAPHTGVEGALSFVKLRHLRPGGVSLCGGQPLPGVPAAPAASSRHCCCSAAQPSGPSCSSVAMFTS